MADSNPRQQPSKTERFLRGAGSVQDDPEHRLWGPAKWVVQMIQYLVAIIMITVAEGIKAIFTGKKPSGRRRAANAKTA